MDQRHARHDLREFGRRGGGPGEAIPEEGMHVWRTFQEDDVGTNRGQQKSIPAEASGGVDDSREGLFPESRGLDQGVAASAATPEPVADGTSDEIKMQLLGAWTHEFRIGDPAQYRALQELQSIAIWQAFGNPPKR
jgi:hypothetical protein